MFYKTILQAKRKLKKLRERGLPALRTLCESEGNDKNN